MSGKKSAVIVISVSAAIVLCAMVFAVLSLNSPLNASGLPASVKANHSSYNSAKSPIAAARAADSSSAAASSGVIKGLKIDAYVNGEPLYDVYIKSYDYEFSLPGRPADSAKTYNFVVREMVQSQEAESNHLQYSMPTFYYNFLLDYENYSKKHPDEDQSMKDNYNRNMGAAKACGLSYKDYINYVYVPQDRFYNLSKELQDKFNSDCISNDSYKRAEKDWDTYESNLVKRAVIKKAA